MQAKLNPVEADGGADPEPAAPDVGGFITVTNKDTQHITVISPQR